VGTARFGKVAGTLRSAGKGNRRRHCSVASLGKHGTAAPHTDTDTDAYAERNSIDLADSFCVTDTDSDVQRGTLAHVTTADPSHIRVSDANAKPDRNVLTRIGRERAFIRGAAVPAVGPPGILPGDSDCAGETPVCPGQDVCAPPRALPGTSRVSAAKRTSRRFHAARFVPPSWKVSG
jgi:hypothetical protein